MIYFDQNPDVFETKTGIRISFADVSLILPITDASWLAKNIQRTIRRVTLTYNQRRNLKVGDKVLVTDDNGELTEYVVRQSPWQLGHGEWVVGLTGITGGYLLDRVVRLIQQAAPND